VSRSIRFFAGALTIFGVPRGAPLAVEPSAQNCSKSEARFVRGAYLGMVGSRLLVKAT
jgi:hypothetical protein